MEIKRIFALTAALAVLAGCGNRLTKDQHETFSELEQPQQLCGGYTQRELTDEEMAMFKSVTGTGDIVYTPLSVSTQVVAGTNYKFYCRFEDAGDGKYGYCRVTIFKPLPDRGEPRLVSIEKE